MLHSNDFGSCILRRFILVVDYRLYYAIKTYREVEIQLRHYSPRH
jgi:hypothetical protein